MISEWLDHALGISAATQTNVLWSLVTVSVFAVLRAIILRIVYRQTSDVSIRYHARKITTYVCVILGILIVGRIWFTLFHDIGTFLGLFSAGLAIALRDLVAAVAGWLYLLVRRPFDVGDRIQIGEHAGDVIDIRLFRFTLMEIGNWVEADQSTGRIIHVPNGKILVDVIANYSKGFQYIWNELKIQVTFESDWEKAKEILQRTAERHSSHLSEVATEAVREAAKRAMIIYSTLTPRVWTSVADSGVLLTIRYLCDPRQRRSTAEKIWEDVLREFGRCDDIDFAYPTIRRYINVEEGKPGTGGPSSSSSDSPVAETGGNPRPTPG